VKTILTMPASRISKGSDPTLKDIKVTPLRDHDQPFIYDVRLFGREYRFKIFDTAGPTPWSELKPDVIVLCFDISQRLSLINMQHIV
jgi:Ras family protein A